MKRILIILPVVLCILLSSVSLMPVSAKYDDKYTITENGVEYVRNHDFEPVDDEYYYISFNCPDYYSPGNNGAFFGMRIEDTTAVESLVITEESGVFTFDFSAWKNNPGLPSFFVYFLGSTSDRHNDVQYVVYDSNSTSESVSIIFDGGYTRKITASEHGLCHFQTNLTDVNGSLEVEFVPFELSGDVKEEMEIDGQLWKSYALQMIVTNNTNKNYQYAWFITPHGERPSFSPNISSSSVRNIGANGYGFSGNVSWVHVKNDWAWIISPDLVHAYTDSAFDSSDLSDSINGTQYTYLPCSWTFISGHSENTESAMFANMKLYSGQQYDCLVYAVPTECNQLSFLSSEYIQSRGWYSALSSKCVDFSQTELIYSSSFTMGFTTDFNPDLVSPGGLSFDPDSNLDDFFNTSSARLNPDTGSYEYDYNLSKDYSSSRNFSFSGSAGSSNLSTFSSAFSNVFAFISSFFSFLPSAFQQLFFFGFTTVIVVAIIKAVK